MPRTVSEGFKQLSRNLEITTLQNGTVSTRQKNVRAAVAAELAVDDDFLVGSRPRNTMKAPLADADVDIFTVLNPIHDQPYNPAGVLDDVKRVLKKTYPGSAMSRNGQAVTIKFNDFSVDVVPAFKIWNGWRIPDTERSRYINTDPKKHIELWSIMNQARDNKFIPLIKMLKGWNAENGHKLRSFHLETIAWHIFHSTGIDEYPQALAYFFQQAQNYIWLGSNDPAGLGGDVGVYLDTYQKKLDITSLMETAQMNAVQAINHDAGHCPMCAFDCWKKVFGDYFPSYG